MCIEMCELLVLCSTYIYQCFVCYCSWKALYCLKGKKWKMNELKCSCRFNMIEKPCKHQKYEISDCQNIHYAVYTSTVHHVHVCVFFQEHFFSEQQAWLSDIFTEKQHITRLQSKANETFTRNQKVFDA